MQAVEPRREWRINLGMAADDAVQLPKRGVPRVFVRRPVVPWAEGGDCPQQEMRTARRWSLFGPTPFLALSVALGVTTWPVGAIGAPAGVVGSVLPAVGQLREQRRRPAYALVMAKRRRFGR
jgi:hypothetical protein